MEFLPKLRIAEELGSKDLPHLLLCMVRGNCKTFHRLGDLAAREGYAERPASVRWQSSRVLLRFSTFLSLIERAPVNSNAFKRPFHSARLRVFRFAFARSRSVGPLIYVDCSDSDRLSRRCS